MKLVRLIYASRLLNPLSKPQVQQLLSTSRARNGPEQITGYLCLSSGYALQCLEGPRDAVNRLYNRIAHDPRHEDVTVLRYVEPWRRLFPDWNMGYAGTLSQAAPSSARWRDATGFNPYLVESDLIENVIESLCEQLERVALVD